MRKVVLACLVVILSFSLLVSVTVLPSPSDASIPVFAGPQNSAHDLKSLADMGMRLEIPTENAAVSPSVALQNANKTFPSSTRNSTDTRFEYHLLTNNSFKLFSEEALAKNPKLKSENTIDKLPVYIISYKVGRVAGLPTGRQDTRKEFNVVVDATTGVPLYAFSYR